MGKIVVRFTNLIFVHAMIALSGTPSSAWQCTHYASPTGAGSGASTSQPFKIADFWPRAKPGYTLCLTDGRYTGSRSMINPPKNLSGTSTLPITVRALNEGQVSIDGQSNNLPVRLFHNDHFVLEGFNAHDSKATVIEIARSSHNTVRKITAWDAADGNNAIFGIHNGTHNLLEDVAGWGIARKIFSASQGGDYTTIRRAWGRWEASHVVGPKMTYTLAYNNHHMICENCIGTWSGERMKHTGTLLDYYGKPWTGHGAGTYTNYDVDQPYGVFAIDGLGADKHAHARLLGSIAYVRRDDRFAPTQVIFVTKLESFEIRDTAVFVGTDRADPKRFSLHNLSGTAGTNLIARNLTGIGGGGSFFGSAWKKTDISEGSVVRSVPNVFSSNRGARLCYRYKDGTLTNEPLWTWPMNQRIRDGLVASGRSGVDVTATIEAMFGPIPGSCKSTGP